MKKNALKLFLNQRRFDLIFKYLYVKNPTDFNKVAYLENIRAFNNFYELNPSDKIPKNSATDFINSFNSLIKSISENQYDNSKGLIPIGKNGEITDGAHRLSVCSALGLDVTLIDDTIYNEYYPYSFFRKKGMNEEIMDYGALEYVKLNPNAYIVNIHSVVDTHYDNEIEKLLEKYGFIYYKKFIKLNLNAYVHLKRISYGYFWEKDSQWIGTKDNLFVGAKQHAKKSLGRFPLRAYVYVCDDISKILEVKQEIRDLVKIGNFSVHINDTHDEAICLAETYFNYNTLNYIKRVPYYIEDKLFNDRLDNLKSILIENKIEQDNICCVGSTPLNICGVRESEDIDYLSIDGKFRYEDSLFSPHDSQLLNYPYNKEEIVTNPKNYFYYRGFKFITLDVLLKMKIKRHEYPKDYKDIILIYKIKINSLILLMKNYLLRNKYIVKIKNIFK